MSKLSRRTLVTSAAALPALAVPAFASGALGPDHPDAELLRLGAKLDPIIRRWAAKRAVEVQWHAEWEAICERAGLPRIEGGTIADDDWHAHQEKRWAIRPAHEEEDEVDERGWSVDWMDILETLDTLTKEIISRKAQTVSGLAVQARAMTVYYSELWDGGRSDDDPQDHRNFIEAVCAFVGITPEPLLAARLGGGVQS